MKTGEIFEVYRKISERDLPFFAEDGTECTRIISKSSGWRKDREVFEVDPSYVKQMNPKYVKFRDGHRERYDETRHC